VWKVLQKHQLPSQAQPDALWAAASHLLRLFQVLLPDVKPQTGGLRLIRYIIDDGKNTFGSDIVIFSYIVFIGP
jgi:hypothetical protein